MIAQRIPQQELSASLTCYSFGVAPHPLELI